MNLNDKILDDHEMVAIEDIQKYCENVLNGDIICLGWGDFCDTMMEKLHEGTDKIEKL